LRILIVEDNLSFLSLLRKFIKRNISSNPEIRECSGGQDALQVYQTFAPDWVLMDIMMEPMDGLVAARKIKELDPSARIVIVTQHNERAYRDAARETGVAAYVLKENIDDLRSVLIER
jgi:CheY-like chemotaxis protein